MRIARNKQTVRVMGIDPGVRYVGIAVICDEDLLHALPYDVSDESVRRRCARARRLVRTMLEAFEPSLVVVERSFFPRRGPGSALRQVCDAIDQELRRSKIATKWVTPTQVKRATTESGRANKEEVATACARRYPILQAFTHPTRNWKRRVLSNLFDAVALASHGHSPSNQRTEQDEPRDEVFLGPHLG